MDTLARPDYKIDVAFYSDPARVHRTHRKDLGDSRHRPAEKRPLARLAAVGAIPCRAALVRASRFPEKHSRRLFRALGRNPESRTLDELGAGLRYRRLLYRGDWVFLFRGRVRRR